MPKIGYKTLINRKINKIMTELLVVQSKVKEVAKNAKMNTAGDFGEALSTKVEGMVKEAVNRAKANGRKTIRGCDL